MNQRKSKVSASEQAQAKEELEKLGKQIAARCKTMRKYEEAAYEKAGYEYDKAKAEREAIENKLLPEARAQCKAAGVSFAEFKKKYCPDMGRTKLYQVLAIADGRTSIEKIREKEREKKRTQRAKQNGGLSGTGDVPNTIEQFSLPALLAPAPTVARQIHSPEIPIEERQAQMGALAEADLSPEERSDGMLKAFKEGQGSWVDQVRGMLPPDRQRARAFFAEFTDKLDKKDRKNAEREAA